MPSTRAQLYRRRRIAVFGGAGVFLAALAYLPMTLLAPIDANAPSIVEYGAPESAPAAITWPDSTAIAIGAVGYPGVLASQGSEDALPIASITKIITAMTVLEQHPLAVGEAGPTLTFTSADAAFYGEYLAVLGSVEPVQAGLTLTEYQVLQAVLISSANNYARSLGIWAFGSDEAFVAAANDWLARQGLEQTTLVEATGIDPGNRSTTSDLVELAKLALGHPVIAEIVATPSVHLPYIGTIKSSNKILGSVGVDGIKTGTLPEAGACLLFSTDILVGTQSITVVGVALGGVKHSSQYPQVVSLLASVQDDFHEVTLTNAGDAFGFYTTPWGQKVSAVATETRTVVLWGDTAVSTAVSLDPVGLASKGARVGEAVFTAGAESVAIALELDGALTDPGPLWRLSNPGELIG